MIATLVILGLIVSGIAAVVQGVVILILALIYGVKEER